MAGEGKDTFAMMAEQVVKANNKAAETDKVISREESELKSLKSRLASHLKAKISAAKAQLTSVDETRVWHTSWSI